MSKFCWISLFLFLTSCSNDKNEIHSLQKKALDTANFTTVLWSDSVANFGTIQFGEKVKLKFHCTNTGTKPLIIANARPGCGCTVADYTKQPIAPGKQGEVTAVFNSGKNTGAVTKSIIVTTNTSNMTEHYLSFSGNIEGGPNPVDKVMVPHEKH